MRRPAAHDRALQPVHLQVGHAQHGFLAGDRRAARERVHAREQLGERERLHEVVVRAGLQPLDAVAHAAQRRQHEHRRLDPGGAHRLDDGKTVDARQHAVYDHDVVARLGGEKQPVAAVLRLVDHVAAFPQPVRDESRGVGVVFNQQNLHGQRPEYPAPVSRPAAGPVGGRPAASGE